MKAQTVIRIVETSGYYCMNCKQCLESSKIDSTSGRSLCCGDIVVDRTGKYVMPAYRQFYEVQS